MKRTIIMGFIMLLVAFYVYTFWLAVNPSVSDVYRQYYIERSLQEWPRQGAGAH